MTVTQELPWGGLEKLVFLGRKDKGFCTWNIKSHPKVSKVQFTKNEEIKSIRWGSDGKKLFCGLWYDRILDKGSVKMNYMRIKWPSRVAKQQQQLWWLTASLLVNIMSITAVVGEIKRTTLRTKHHCCVFLLGMIFLSENCNYMLPPLIGRCYHPSRFVCLSFHSSFISFESFLVFWSNCVCSAR